MYADEAANRRIAERFLLKLGLSREGITLLDSGEAALAYLTNVNIRPPDMVLLDITMGAKSGLVVMQELGKQAFPVVACTAHVTELDQSEFKRAGFSGLLGKPFTLQRLKDLLTAIVERHDTWAVFKD